MTMRACRGMGKHYRYSRGKSINRWLSLICISSAFRDQHNIVHQAMEMG